MLQTACATTATAASFSPCSAPEAARPSSCPRPSANASMNSADGRVKAIQAAAMPAQPARASPSAMPVWLLAGPGRNWHSATSSA
ncbi:Uncharacterised protein [Bordetella pertussis]|nr:Uncharacterised protein [Bordetella pertussis]